MTEEQFQALPEDPGEILETADAQFLELGDEKLMSQLLEYWKKA